MLIPSSTFSIHLCVPSDICWCLFCLDKTSKLGSETITVASWPDEGPQASSKCRGNTISFNSFYCLYSLLMHIPHLLKERVKCTKCSPQHAFKGPQVNKHIVLLTAASGGVSPCHQHPCRLGLIRSSSSPQHFTGAS